MMHFNSTITVLAVIVTFAFTAESLINLLVALILWKLMYRYSEANRLSSGWLCGAEEGNCCSWGSDDVSGYGCFVCCDVFLDNVSNTLLHSTSSRVIELRVNMTPTINSLIGSPVTANTWFIRSSLLSVNCTTVSVNDPTITSYLDEQLLSMTQTLSWGCCIKPWRWMINSILSIFLLLYTCQRLSVILLQFDWLIVL